MGTGILKAVHVQLYEEKRCIYLKIMEVQAHGTDRFFFFTLARPYGGWCHYGGKSCKMKENMRSQRDY